MFTQGDRDKLKYSIIAIEFNPVDRFYLLSAIASNCPKKKIYYWNSGYDCLQEYAGNKLIETKFIVGSRFLKVVDEVEEAAVIVFEGTGQIDRSLGFELKNFYFGQGNKSEQQLVLGDSYLDIPEDLFAIVKSLRVKIPNIEQIQKILIKRGLKDYSSLANTCFGLHRGEIEMLLDNSFKDGSIEILSSAIIKFKSQKLAEQGLQIAPAPDIDAVGGLDRIEEDLEMIRAMNTSQARERGLSLPKACLLLGLPGTGKSLISKLMGKKLGAILVSCDWNQLLDNDNLARSQSNLQRVLDVVDNIGGTCILFFDEFEKAYSGWNTGGNGGVLAKMAGTLLKWMQDHTTPVILLATINHIDMLPPELIRRFEYGWFFDSDLHNGAMLEIFLLHINKHFPALNASFSISRSQWFDLFDNYRGCSPDEIAKAVTKAHQRLFFKGMADLVDAQTLKEALIYQRSQFTPATENPETSDALYKIRKQKAFFRPVRGEDKSEFAVRNRGMFEVEQISTEVKERQIQNERFKELLRLFRLLLDTEPDRNYSYAFLPHD